MKIIFFLLICLTTFLLTFSDSSNVVLDHKENRNQLENLVDMSFLKVAENHELPLNDSQTSSNSADEVERNTASWIEGDKQTNHKKLKAGNSASDAERVRYTFEKGIRLQHHNKKPSKKIRDKIRILKRIKHQNYEKDDKHPLGNEHKDKKDVKKRENPHKKIINDFSEPDPILNIPMGDSGPIAKEFFEIDPVLNMVQSNVNRRHLDKNQTSESSDEESSRLEFGDFREQFKAFWLQKKYEALNSTIPDGDQVIMGGTRPWGVKCGDANQHDMPWGTCMLPMECDVKYRIYNGDVYCGRTSFVCCALEVVTYDMYQEFDVKFEDKSTSEDSDEANYDRQRARENQKKRREARKKRKKRIKKTRNNITREMKNILTKSYANATNRRKKKAKQLQRFIKFLKTEYKKNRHMVQDLYEEATVKIDAELMKKLYDIREMNHNFMLNQTFADIVVNGTKKGARMLIQAYPALQEFIDKTPPLTPPIVGMAEKNNNRFGGALSEPKDKTGFKQKGDYLEYDVQYGFLYY
ncbi:uncharacterized protein LOC113239950 [Hyposmocoma kahamanoa]|uniref:uncharacterized protein LOC113239950 n=1 Tax=Hyposmocoma kahamanoa TaxID=1477025 RepID=UPI000E6D85AF|nr:uncharacterized protein LOC113239950 [Hyposmocoma kahamanoa]